MFSPYNQTDLRYRDASSPVNIEPMTLGSPVSSPKSPRNKPNSQNYLPSYLFGDTVTSPISSPGWHTPTTAPKQLNQSAFQSSANLTTPITRFKEQDPSFQSVGSTSSILTTPNTPKNGGPPIQGLMYSTPSQSSFNPLQLDNTQNVSGRLEGPNFSSVLTPSKSFCAGNTSYMSPAQIDPFFTQGEALKNSDQLDESWVTVFGFPSASATYILQQFSQHGNIVEHKISPTGNWMHLKYQSRLQAKKALSKNGKVFSGNIMIGVKPCIEMDLMESYKDNSILEKSTMSESIQNETQEPLKNNLKNIRPLTQAYQSPNTQIQETNAKSGSIVSKAFEYLWKLH